MGILSEVYNNINLEDVNFNEDDPKTIVQVRLVAWCNGIKLCKAFNKELSKVLINTCIMASKKMVGLEHARI